MGMASEPIPFSEPSWFNSKRVYAPHAARSIQEHMHEKSLVTLEYPKIIARLVDEAAFSASKELVRELTA